jgi:preprotein translocase subunit SecE
VAARTETRRAQAPKPSRPTPPRRGIGAPGTGERRGNYLKEVVGELRKVVWPTWGELTRMTGIVIATVILLTVIIGGSDWILTIIVPQPK